MSWTPRRLLCLYAAGLHFVAFHVLRRRVRLARRNLTGTFPELHAPEREREQILRKSFHNLSRTLMDVIWGARASAGQLLRRVAFDNPEVIEKYRAARQSVVLLTAHVRNWEWLLVLIDMVVISNLLIMVIVGGYETFVSRMRLESHPDQPEWLSRVKASVLKVKLATAIIGISSIHLLKNFINAENYSEKVLLWQTLTHVTLLLSALAIAATDRLMPHARRGDPH